MRALGHCEISGRGEFVGREECGGDVCVYEVGVFLGGLEGRWILGGCDRVGWDLFR